MQRRECSWCILKLVQNKQNGSIFGSPPAKKEVNKQSGRLWSGFEPKRLYRGKVSLCTMTELSKHFWCHSHDFCQNMYITSVFVERRMHSSTPSPKSGNDFKDVYLSSLQQSIALSLSCVCLLHAAHSLLCRAHYCVLCFFDMLIFSITNVTYNLQASLNRRV
jgi:hypothetical protein